MKKKIIYFLLSTILLNSCSIKNEEDNSELTKISYKDYVESVKSMKENDKEIIVFTQTSCIHCAILRPLLNRYNKKDLNENIKLYEVSFDVSNGAFVDETLGVYDGSSNDYAKKFDIRLQMWANRVNSDDLDFMIEGTYHYLSTPLIIWYDSGIEVKMSNKVASVVDVQSYDSFKSFMEFPTKNPNFTEPFNLTYNEVA